MKFERYLKEEYHDSYKVSGMIFDVYKNPTKSELSELKKFGMRGYRFVVDAKNKDFYIFDSELTHSYALEHIFKGFNYIAFYTRGKNADHIFVGHADKYKLDNIESDTFLKDFPNLAENNDNGYKILDALERLAKYDFSWMDKYFPSKQIDEIIGKSYDLVSKVLQEDESED